MPKSEKASAASPEQLRMANMPEAPGEAEAEGSPEGEAGAGAAKVFRAYDPKQILLLPPNLDEWLPAEHMARLIDDLVEKMLDLSAVYADYKEVRGAPPYHPKLLLKLLLYGYANGIFSSRKLERAAHELVPCRYLTADQRPDHKTISEFRRRHLKAVRGLFLQVLRICQQAKLVKLGHVALDGTKIRANASKHKAMSYGRMREREPELEWIVKELLEKAEEIDRAEDAKYGRDRRGDELPEELQRAESRLRRLREAKAALEREAQEEGREEPEEKAQRNFTDPDSKIMVNSDKAYVQAYNCQLAVDDTPHQVALAAEVSNQASDNPQLVPMLIETILNVEQKPKKLSADAGYSAETNLRALEALDIDAYVAINKERHQCQETCPSGRIPKSAGIRERMQRKLRTQKGRGVYRRRKHVAEPPFGFLKQALGFRQFLLRGLEKVDAEWKLVVAAYNLTRLYASRRWQVALASR